MRLKAFSECKPKVQHEVNAKPFFELSENEPKAKFEVSEKNFLR